MRRTTREGESGAVTVEFVVVATVLFLILFSLVEFAFIFNARLVLTGAAREGARRAAVEGGVTDGVLECIEEYLRLGNVKPEEVEIDITPRQASYGTPVRVRLTYAYPVMTAMMRSMIGPTVVLTAEVLSRGEKVRARGD